MRFHVVSLPHTHTTAAFPSCAFTQKVRRFCQMMGGIGHHVTLYAGEQNDVPCDEHVSCISETRRAEMVGEKHYTEANWSHPHWAKFNARVIAEIHDRIEPGDIICLIGGYAHKKIADEFPNNKSVEFGIGYAGVFSKYRVFESYAWMHTVIGAQSGGNAANADGSEFDTVIPNQIEDSLYDFAPAAPPHDYALYVGRLVDRKGYKIAQDICQAKGLRLILAGPGTPSGYGEFLGEVDAVKRTELMRNAKCLFAPTIYVEPFGTVHVEAMACGTPIIASDWGVFTETITQGVHGFRCRSFNEFSNALDLVDQLDRKRIRDDAFLRFSMSTVAKQYDAYFTRLANTS